MARYILNKLVKLLSLDKVILDVEIQRKINNCYENSCAEQAIYHEEAKVYNCNNIKTLITIDESTHIRGELLVFAYGGKINIGRYCYIGEGTRIWSGDSVFIGNNVLISHNVNIIDTNSHEINHQERAEGFRQLITNGHAKVKGDIRTAPIIINDHAWISFNASILKGVVVGEGAIVAASAVVTKDVPPWSVVAGNPAVVIKQL